MTASPAKVLVELQTADVEILRAQKRLDELPEKKAILEARAKIRETAALREKVALLGRKLAAELKSRQDEIAMHTEKIAAEQVKIMATTDHRQIQALTREMDGLKRRIDKLEMECMQYMERSDKAAEQLATVDAHLQRLTDGEAKLVERFRSAGGAVQDEIARLTGRRQALAASLDAELLGRYEKTREAKGGVAVGTLSGVTCTACHMSLPAERVAELQAGPDVGVCPQCRRLIVVRDGDTE